ncbi:MAG TPA: SBBP repeat-containing protein [Vicinamibacterales bacterium]|jgi:mannose-6-phosphate isomerase-like protein (cupin superfamily)
MKKNILRTLALLVAAGPAIASAQAPKDAIVVSDADIKAVLKMAADTKRTIPDNTLRVIDMGTYQLGVAVVARGKLAPAPAPAAAAAAPAPNTPACGQPRAGATGPNGIYHDSTSETYIVTSGSGTMITGGTIVNGRRSPADSEVTTILNGPSCNGTMVGYTSRVINVGDIIVIPEGVPHGFSAIPDHVTYLSVRPDLKKVLQKGYVNPALAGKQTTAARSLPTFEVDRGWPKVPAQWKLGDVSSFAVDAQDHIWALHRPRTLLKPEDVPKRAPAVMVFDGAGNYLKSWGGDGAGYEWPQREHGIHIDNKGFVWITGNNCPTNGIANLKPVADDQILKFTQDGKFVMQIGHSNQSKGNADTTNVHRAADVQVNPRTNELIVADGYGNHRVIVFDADSGRFKRMWGAFGNKPVDDDHCEVVTPKEFPPGDGPSNFSIVHAVRLSKDGTVYVADRENRRVQSFTADGKFLKQIVKTDTQFARDLAFSADPDQQFLYVGNGNDILIVERKAMAIVGSIKLPGQIGGGHHIATDSKGNIYIAGTTMGLQKLTFKGMSTASTN